MSESMFGTKEFENCDYLALLNGLQVTEPKCYFTVFEGDKKVTNEKGSDQLEYISGHFVKIFFTMKETKTGPSEKVNIILQKGTKSLLWTSFWNDAVRRLLSCFDKGAQIGELYLTAYNINDCYVDKATGKEIETIKKGISIHHNGELMKPIISKAEKESMIKIYTDDKGKRIKTDNDKLNAYLKEIALTWKPQEAVRTAPVEQATVEETKTEFKTPITDNIKAKQEEEDNEPLPF